MFAILALLDSIDVRDRIHPNLRQTRLLWACMKCFGVKSAIPMNKCSIRIDE